MRPPRLRRPQLAPLLCALLLLTGGPGELRAAPSANPKSTVAKMSAEEIETRLAIFYATFVNTVSAVVERQGTSDADLDRLRRLTLSKIRAVRACRSTVFQTNPRNALIDTWALCLQFKVRLEGESGERIYGVDAPALREAARRLQAEIEAVAADVLAEEDVLTVRARFEAFYRELPSADARATAPPTSTEIQSALPDLGWLFKLPLAPFRALAGVDNTAQALVDLGHTTEKLTQIAANLPLEVSWETEMLLLQVRRDSAVLLADALAQADRRTQLLIDHLFWRGLQLIGAALAAALVYRLLVHRLPTRHSP
jgi:hypothetical protein